MVRGKGSKGVQLRGSVKESLEIQTALNFLRSKDAQKVLKSKPWDLVLDMDDTLITNQLMFERSTKKLHSIYKKWDKRQRSDEDIAKLHDSVDLELIPELGYSPRRWRTSALAVAEIILERDLADSEQEEVLAAAGIALGTGTILPGVRDVLHILRRSGVRLIMKTKGDRRMQKAKIEAHEFERVFDEIVIVKDKTERSFKSVVGRFDLNNPVMIGDSVRSDILPAIATGNKAVLIQANHPVWEHEQLEHPDLAKAHRAPSLVRAVQILVEKEMARSL